jgi:hypothetical protein
MGRAIPLFMLDLRQRLKDISEFLQPYQRIWQNEIMLDYPHPFDGYPADWLEEIMQVEDAESLMRLEKKDYHGIIKLPSLVKLYETIETLTDFPQIPELPKMPEEAHTFLYVIPKKQHEIRKLAPFVNAFYHHKRISKIVDIGGGIGLLAQSLNNQYQLRVQTVDLDPELQATGSSRHDYNAKDPKNKVIYHELKVAEDNHEFLKLIDTKTMTLGLHTCGELALHQLTSSSKAGAQAVINFGCCYQKVENPKYQNVSQFAQGLSTKCLMHKFALTLAARAHRKTSPKDYSLKNKVKYFRYSIHMLLHDHYKKEGIVSLGNSPKGLYDASFSEYARVQFQRIGLEPLTDEELNQFYNSSKNLLMVKKMLAAGFIRNVFGRALEAYLLLDRAIFMEENGYKSEIMSFFDEETSPRNLGIVCQLR